VTAQSEIINFNHLKSLINQCGTEEKAELVRMFEKGAPVVLVSGCHIGECHYIDANHWTVKRVEKVRKKMEKLGIMSERLQLEWISAAEGIRFAKVMADMEALRKSVSAEEIEETVRILQERRKADYQRNKNFGGIHLDLLASVVIRGNLSVNQWSAS
jgi:coenzyme F420-reducing hydrogenase delta subunit